MSNPDWLAPAASLAGVAVGGLLNHILTRGKFFKEREWEKKREMYSEMIAGLAIAVDICTLIDEGYGEDPHTFDRSDRRNKLVGEVWAALHKAEAAYMKDYLFLSNAVRSRFESLQIALRDTNDNNIPPDEWSANLEKIRSARDDIMRAALTEIRRRWWQRSFHR